MPRRICDEFSGKETLFDFQEEKGPSHRGAFIGTCESLRPGERGGIWKKGRERFKRIYEELGHLVRYTQRNSDRQVIQYPNVFYAV